ncbi:mevalonate kinase [Candidatus Daviesbacteria bacterium RIFCSPHIGHO2_01_FULL_40_24]|uniref:Mevalonate kinase n=1 Tax=Candidatus Daviesbacteria bacterium GW2011_GWC2_40_12 TaxID=1618431 RepID=A0A0G0TW86_9BACT|nr:MAG: Mevalonate kinase [Candidatus Daviesbacteria bacterium GW2011_GWA2_39_33]KKR42217.1 MAG: Mevalonate kinase [Candidatus Daviesbacteria bacterium GW2011_GWC2_40_12]OGE21962.1 MAG: mevalonate kinase [Candidatus Daviesbacteria bacterium RIFCSPHIGHO2_01_FULL_40_24]OGE30312.1 MAG: mevalonate kinase [Candidatus Daviesbacteria bacterium RIFCSPHIGHO2_02_FULL_40_16]OGE42859.1 MAG: mevalonate kinase [Candidatus Daviesbacteria bacterium RIFCSPLOWO2_01_FULL_39_23]OGE66488.1 MAG: mevalonate kinase [
MKREITISAPGKLMLLGEHAVVYNRPCIVTAVGQRMRATVELTEKSTFQLNAPDVQIANYQKPMDQLGIGDLPKGAKFVEIAVVNFLRSLLEYSRSDLVKPGVKVSTTSEFSSQFGFGSSSASTVCVIKALSEITEANLNNKEIFDLAYKTVLDIQGKGSGFDAAAATFGGTLYFVTGGKTIEPLNIDSLPLIVGYSGIKADTVTLINQVKEKAGGNPQAVEDIYDNIGKLVEQAKLALLGKDWQSLGELMNENQKLLTKLGVSINKLDDMIAAALKAGAYGAKLSGAGGGDCMIALAPEDKVQAVKDGITSVGGQIIEVETNAEGARIETRD